MNDEGYKVNDLSLSFTFTLIVDRRNCFSNLYFTLLAMPIHILAILVLVEKDASYRKLHTLNRTEISDYLMSKILES